MEEEGSHRGQLRALALMGHFPINQSINFHPAELSPRPRPTEISECASTHDPPGHQKRIKQRSDHPPTAAVYRRSRGRRWPFDL